MASSRCRADRTAPGRASATARRAATRRRPAPGGGPRSGSTRWRAGASPSGPDPVQREVRAGSWEGELSRAQVQDRPAQTRSGARHRVPRSSSGGRMVDARAVIPALSDPDVSAGDVEGASRSPRSTALLPEPHDQARCSRGHARRRSRRRRAWRTACGGLGPSGSAPQGDRVHGHAVAGELLGGDDRERGHPGLGCSRSSPAHVPVEARARRGVDDSGGDGVGRLGEVASPGHGACRRRREGALEVHPDPRRPHSSTDMLTIIRSRRIPGVYEDRRPPNWSNATSIEALGPGPVRDVDGTVGDGHTALRPRSSTTAGRG